MAWKLVYGSVRGTSHAQSGQPCQDDCAAAAAGSLLVAACSDGAGSAELSHVGSRLAVERFMALACRSSGKPERAAVAAWVEEARSAVIVEASVQGVPPRQLACTLLGAVAGEDWIAFAQVGDGVIAFDGDGRYQLAFWPDNGEYANTTRFLTDDDFPGRLRVEVLDRRVGELAVLTDGLQMLAIDYAQARPHGPFFAPLFKAVRSGPDGEALRAALLGFLDSKPVNDRTDDDKSLVLAIRDHEQPA